MVQNGGCTPMLPTHMPSTTKPIPALKKAGVEHQLVLVEGAPHSFHLQPKQRDLRPLVLGFFDKHLKAK